MILRPCRYYPHRRVLFQPLCQSSTLSTPSTTPYELLPLPRSLPAHHALLLLHIPIPPTSWPPRLELASQLISEASKHLKHSKIAVNAIYDGSGSSTTFSAHEVYPARLLYPDGRVFTFPSFSKASLDSAELQAGLNHSAAIESLNEASIGRYAGDGEHEILVCTHGARDCRCSDRGGPLVEALRAEISRRGVEGRVRVNEIAHVGGHKYAANAILLPGLDLLSNLDSSYAPAVLSHLLTGRPKKSGMWEHWRGRYGLTEAQQQTVWSKVDTSVQEKDGIQRIDQTQKKEMVSLRFRTFEGDLLDIEAQIGQTLLEVARANDLPSLEGVCGGNLECATCHLYLPTSPTPPVPEPGNAELDMLGYAIGFREGLSRLGCQIKVTRELVDWVTRGGMIGLPRY